jgi:exonuclease VII large subunit
LLPLRHTRRAAPAQAAQPADALPLSSPSHIPQLSGFTIATRADLEQAARKFAAHYRRLRAAQAQEWAQELRQQQQDAAAAITAENAQRQQQQQSRRRTSRVSGGASGGASEGSSFLDTWGGLRPQLSAPILRSEGGRGSTSGGGGSGGGGSGGGGAGSFGSQPSGATVRTAGAAARKQQQQKEQKEQQKEQQQQGAKAGGRPVISVEALHCGDSDAGADEGGITLGQLAAAMLERDKRRPGWWIQFK